MTRHTQLGLVLAILTAGRPVQAQTTERPVGLVMAAGSGKLLRAGTELPLSAKDGDVLYAGDGLASGASPATLLFCPERTSFKLEPDTQVVVGVSQIKVVRGGVAERSPVGLCTLPELEREPASSQQHYGGSFTRALKPAEAPATPRLERIPQEHRMAFEAELAEIDRAIAANPMDKAARIARAVLFEKYKLAAEALDEYTRIGLDWPDATWVGSRIFVHEKEAGRQAPPSVVTPEGGQVYAVLIGISKYMRLPEQQWLRYAHEDAVVFDAHLRSPRGGMLPPQNLVVLTNEEATTAAIKNAFETSLKARAGKNDTVVLFIAAHGVTESTGRRGAYIITHDSDPEDLASTAISMADVQNLIREDLSRVGHVLVYVDVCRAGNIGALRGANTVNKAVEQLAEVEGDLLLFLASGPKEFSYEGPQYGGGHGAFSYFLLDGLNGGADQDKNQRVTVGELIEFVRERVVEATNGRQHPRDLGSMEHKVTVSELHREGVLISKVTLPGQPAAMGVRGSGAGADSDRPADFTLTEDLENAIGEGRLLPDAPQSAFAALRALRRQLNPEQLLLAENRLRVALENEGQLVLLRYLAGEQRPQARADFLRGAAHFEAAKLLTPESLFLEGRAWFCQGRALLFEKDYRRSIAMLERAARIDPRGAYSYNALGIAYLEQADYPTSLLAFRDAIRNAPNWAYPLHNMALAYTQSGDYDSAIRSYQKAIGLAPGYAYLHYNLGLLYQRLNRRQEAEAALRRAMALEPENGDVSNALGSLKASSGRSGEAEQFYRQALEKSPDLLAARHNLALLLASKPGRISEARGLWRENLVRSPDHMPSLLSLARYAEAEESIVEYRKVLRLKPDYVAARLALAGQLEKAGRGGEALAELQAALKVQPENPSIHEEIGDLEAAAGRTDAAASAYRKALECSPDPAARKRLTAKLRVRK
jgi:tetratricopeptide (TPR) repeat protein